MSFEAPHFGVDVDQEGKALSEGFMEIVLAHLEKLIHGKINPLNLQPWRRYDAVPLMMVATGDELMIYAVEDRTNHCDPSVKISCMFAGDRTRPYYGLDGSWTDGADESLWRGVIEARCGLWFN